MFANLCVAGEYIQVSAYLAVVYMSLCSLVTVYQVCASRGLCVIGEGGDA